jgi:hypothetical protein
MCNESVEKPLLRTLRIRLARFFLLPILLLDLLFLTKSFPYFVQQVF